MKFNFSTRKKIICICLVMCMVCMNALCIPCGAAAYIYYTNTDTPNYETANLDKLYNTGSSPTTDSSWGERIENGGCFITTYAMLLRNLGKKTKSRVVDVRYSLTSTAYRDADPFMVAYANTGFPTISYSSDERIYYANNTSDPVYISGSTIASNFNATHATVNLSGKTDAVKAYNLSEYIKKYPQGVGIYFKNSAGKTHMIVGVGTTYVHNSRASLELVPETVITDPNQGPWDDPSTCISANINSNFNNRRSVSTNMTLGQYFTVCDPVNLSSYPGENVSMDDSWTASVYNFSDIEQLRIIK